MFEVLASPLRRVRSQVREDLRADPYLPYLLLLSLVLAGFWIWHGLPNFATRDERWRVVDPLEPIGFLAEEFSYASLRDGIAYWRGYGATFYLYGALFLPIVLAVLLFGESDLLTHVARHHAGTLWEHWLGAPAWFWTATVLLARLVNVALAVGSVYVTYRIGTLVRDRATGRLAGLLLSLTWGLLVLAHEAGEDVPALFFFLVTVYVALRYVETGSRRTFYLGAFVGGVAIAMKFSSGVGALLLGLAIPLRERRAGRPWRATLGRWRLAALGIAIGVVTILLGYPSVVVGAPAELGGRLGRLFEDKSSPHGWITAPSLWWLLRGWLHGLGLPLAVAGVGGVLAATPRLGDRSPIGDASLLSVVGIWVFLLVYATWAYIRTHHLLPAFALAVLLVALALADLRERRPFAGRVLIAGLVVTSAVYAGAGTLAYASQPRDQAAALVGSNATSETTVETYTIEPQEAAVPHGVTVYHTGDREMMIDGERRDLLQVTWMRAMPRRCPDYVVLGYHHAIISLAPENHSKRANILSSPAKERYVRDLLSEEVYPYEIAGTYGREPRFLDGKGRRDPVPRLLRVGLRPRTIQYGDPQDMGVNQYTVVLERTGECDPGHAPV